MSKIAIRFVPGILILLAVACGGEKPAAPAASGAAQPAETPGTASAPALGSAKPPFGFLHKPQEGEAVHSGDWAFGWALADSGIAQVTVVSDSGTTSTVALGASFPGVAQSYPQYPGADKAGFGFALPKMGSGSHSLTVTLVGKDGSKTEIHRMVRVQ